MTLLAKLIARQEGFGIPGAIPTTHRNPGDLRHSPHSDHPGKPNAIGTIDTVEHGWEDLERQLRIYAAKGLTIAQMVAVYAPPMENNSSAYLANICAGLRCSPNTPVGDALQEEA